MTEPIAASGTTLRSLPVQVIELKDGALLRRGRVQVKIAGEQAIAAIAKVLEATAARAVPVEAIRALFAPQDHAQVDKLVRFLKDRRLLVDVRAGAAEETAVETAEDVFYWHFSLEQQVVQDRLDAKSFAILGVNEISRRMAPALSDAGANLEVIDYPLLRNVRMFDDDGNLNGERWPSAVSPAEFDNWLEGMEGDRLHCVIATSDFGGLHLFRRFNELCVERKINFLPVMLNDLVGHVGPLVVPGETACFECLLARQNSNLDMFEMRQAVDEKAHAGQSVNGYLPSMASIVADVAVVEVIKFYGGLPQMRAGHLIEVNMLAGRMESARVLKAPRCPACSTLRKTPSIALKLSTLLSSQGYNARYSG